MACEYAAAGGALSRLYHYIPWSASKWSTCQCKGQCYACNIVYVINGIVFNILAKGSMCMVVIHVCTEDEAVQ